MPFIYRNKFHSDHSIRLIALSMLLVLYEVTLASRFLKNKHCSGLFPMCSAFLPLEQCFLKCGPYATCTRITC